MPKNDYLCSGKTVKPEDGTEASQITIHIIKKGDNY